MVTRSKGVGLWLALASAATFGSSGPFAKSLLVEGWSSRAIVLLRVTGAGLVLAEPTVLALRGRWSLVGQQVTFAQMAVLQPEAARAQQGTGLLRRATTVDDANAQVSAHA